MIKQAFERGFIKAASEAVLPILAAFNLLKTSNAIGRYFAEKGVIGDATIDYPYRSLAGEAAGALPTLPLNVMNPGLPIPTPLPEMGMAATFGNKENREKKYRKAMEDVAKRETLSNMHHSGKKLAPLFAGLGALGGGLVGASDNNQTIGNTVIGGGVGALGGAALGGGLGYLTGGASGALNTLLTKGPSEDSRERALKMKARHPYLTSLPFGDMIGAGVS